MHYLQNTEIQLDAIKNWFALSTMVDLPRGTRGGITQQYIIYELVHNCRFSVSKRPTSPKRPKIEKIVFPVNVYGRGNHGNPKVVRREDIVMEDYGFLYFE